MYQQAKDSGPPMDRFGTYLRVMAQVELDPRFRSRIDPADVVQQTMLKAIQKWEQFRGQTEAELIAWLRTILTRHLVDVARDYKRKNGDRHRSLEQSNARLASWLVADQSSPSQKAMRHEQRGRVADALLCLPHDQRMALELRHIQGCSVPQICEQMGRSPAAVAGLLRRGLQTLRNRLELST
ncbi:MAG TPA: sigma-70 family RNA polymerase sigma factor [Isosphaeraceae bacterium]|jgi:RNA polymerase sigma-70 factor (ECF subfamily)|nr:sigma-70 family RNA polymerase sigma factor [Isosphaeraceae bacterium]